MGKYVKCAEAKKKPINIPDLLIAIQKAQTVIPLSRCQKLIESMPNRCNEVLKENGHLTKY